MTPKLTLKIIRKTTSRRFRPDRLVTCSSTSLHKWIVAIALSLCTTAYLCVNYCSLVHYCTTSTCEGHHGANLLCIVPMLASCNPIGLALIPVRGPQTSEDVARWGGVETARSKWQGWVATARLGPNGKVGSYDHSNQSKANKSN